MLAHRGLVFPGAGGSCVPVPAEQLWVHGFGWGVPSLWQCRAVNRGAVSLWWEHQLVAG